MPGAPRSFLLLLVRHLLLEAMPGAPSSVLAPSLRKCLHYSLVNNFLARTATATAIHSAHHMPPQRLAQVTLPNARGLFDKAFTASEIEREKKKCFPS